MTNNEKYLNELNNYKASITKGAPVNFYLKFVFKVCEHAINNCDLADYEDVLNIDEDRVSSVEITDIERASIIWLIQYSVKNGIKFPYLCRFYPVPVLQNVATGWIRKNVEANGDYRTAILTHPICDDIENLWRFYDVANITFMDTTGVPMILLNDRELPLTAIHGFQQKCILNTNSAFEVEYVDTALFAFRGNDTDAMAERRIRLTLALTYFTFTAYPQATLKWFEKNKGIPVFPDDILVDALTVANHMMKDKGMPEFTKDINDYTDEYIDNIVKMAEGITIADDLMKRFKHVQVKLRNLYNFTWNCVKKMSVIKPDENK